MINPQVMSVLLREIVDMEYRKDEQKMYEAYEVLTVRFKHTRRYRSPAGSSSPAAAVYAHFVPRGHEYLRLTTVIAPAVNYGSEYRPVAVDRHFVPRTERGQADATGHDCAALCAGVAKFVPRAVMR